MVLSRRLNENTERHSKARKSQSGIPIGLDRRMAYRLNTENFKALGSHTGSEF